MLRCRFRENKKILKGLSATLIAFSFLSSCKSPEAGRIYVKTSKGPEKKILASVTREYYLSKTPNYKAEQGFQDLVQRSYEKVFRENVTDPKKSFSYTVTPMGAVYPFSKVEVSCIASDSLSNSSAFELCSKFFESVKKDYTRLLEEVK